MEIIKCIGFVGTVGENKIKRIIYDTIVSRKEKR
jgi:hypothetical protein